MDASVERILDQVWSAIGGAAAARGAVRLPASRHVLPAVFDVTGLAVATVGAAGLSAAELLATRTGTAVPQVTVDPRAACAAFRSEALFTPIGWELPPAWDPIAGDYPTGDGWIRLHTNYAYHRAAVQRVLSADSQTTVAAAVRAWAGAELETAIVAAGGCSAVMYDRAAWLGSEPGAASAAEPLARITTRPVNVPPGLPAVPSRPDVRPFTGLRVLDLTRVIAGPVCTRFLAAYGADVLRVDPPGFLEVPALVPETAVGKHSAMLDLADRQTARHASAHAGDRAVFEDLVRRAHVLVSGLRPDALSGLGYDTASLHLLNPAIITASLDAYGWDGPWRARRGFDSLVQMSCGIAAAGAAALGRDAPMPLPAQALDHGTGYVLAATIGRALTELHTAGIASDIRCSLVGTANLLMGHPVPGGMDGSAPTWTQDDTEPTATSWGPARRVPPPGVIDGVASDWRVEAGPLGRHPARWSG